MVSLISLTWQKLLRFLRPGEAGISASEPRSFARNVSLLAIGTAVGQAVGMLVAPVLCRLYSVEEFGQYQVYSSLMSFATVAVACRYETAILLPEDSRMAAGVAALGMLLVGATSIVVALALWVGGAAGLLPESVSRLGPQAWWIPLSMACAGFYLITSHWAIREHAYTKIAATRLGQSIAQSVGQLVLGFTARFGVAGLIIGDVLGRGVGAPSLAAWGWKLHRNLFTTITWRDVRIAARRFSRFPLISAGSSIINTAGFALPALMLEGHYGPQVLGWFALGDRLLGVPTTLVGAAISQVYVSEAAKLARSDPSALRRLVIRIPKQLFVVGIWPFLIVGLFGPALFERVFGSSWREAGYYAQILAAMNFINFLIWPLMPTLNILERQTWQLAWDVGRMVMTVATLWLAFKLKCSSGQAVAVYGIARTFACVVIFGMCLFAIKRHAAARGEERTGDSA